MENQNGHVSILDDMSGAAFDDALPPRCDVDNGVCCSEKGSIKPAELLGRWSAFAAASKGL
jgi:hypothetical protein